MTTFVLVHAVPGVAHTASVTSEEFSKLPGTKSLRPASPA